MTSEMVKKAVEEAEDSLKEKQIQEVKQIVLKTLEKINKVEKDISKAKDRVKELEDQRKILRMDLDDMKEGRLDRIAERQEKDEEAKKVSVVIIIKEKETIIERDRSPWYFPYAITWQEYQPKVFGNQFQGAGDDIHYCGSGSNVTGLALGCSALTTVPINCSVAKFSTIGTYVVDGSIVNLR